MAGRALGLDECKALDGYLSEHGLPPRHVARAYKQRRASQAAEGNTVASTERLSESEQVRFSLFRERTVQRRRLRQVPVPWDS